MHDWLLLLKRSCCPRWCSCASNEFDLEGCKVGISLAQVGTLQRSCWLLLLLLIFKEPGLIIANVFGKDRISVCTCTGPLLSCRRALI